MFKGFLSHFLRKIDIFGIRTEFQINSKPKFKSISGGLFTLIYIAATIALFFLLGDDIFFHKNPATGFSQIYKPNGAQLNISRDSYFFILGLQDSNANHFIDPTIYNITVHNGIRNLTTGQVSKIPIPLVPCQKELLPTDPNLQNYFINLVGGLQKLSSIYCIAEGYDRNFSIRGAWDQESFNYVQVKIYPCLNGSSNAVCKDNNTIQNKLSQGFYGFYSTDYLFDLLNYNEPAKIYGRNYYIPTSYTVKKSVVRYISTSNVDSDDGWLYNDPHTTSYYSFSSDIESFSFLKDQDFGNSFFEMQIRKNYYENLYTRSYKKIKTFAGEISGFLNLIILILLLLSKPFTKREYYNTLANNALNFEEVESKDGKKQEKFKQQATILKSMIDSAVLTPQNKNKASEYFHSTMKLRDSPLKLSLWEWIKSFFIRSEVLEIKRKQKTKGLKLIFSQLDIDYILKKFMELDKLKMILLDEDQHKLFEYLPKPVITKDLKIKISYEKKSGINEKPDKTFLFEEDAILKTKNVQSAFEKIINKSELTPIDLKLINMLDENILELLKKEKKPSTEKIENKENEECQSISPRESVGSKKIIKLETKDSIFKNIPKSKL